MCIRLHAAVWSGDRSITPTKRATPGPHLRPRESGPAFLQDSPGDSSLRTADSKYLAPCSCLDNRDVRDDDGDSSAWQVTCPVTYSHLEVSSAIPTGEPASVWNLWAGQRPLSWNPTPDSLPPSLCFALSEAELFLLLSLSSSSWALRKLPSSSAGSWPLCVPCVAVRVSDSLSCPLRFRCHHGLGWERQWLHYAWDTVNQPCSALHTADSSAPCVGCHPGLLLNTVQNRAKQNPSQNGHWLSPVPGAHQGACLAFWLWGQRGKERRRTQKCAQSSAFRVGVGQPTPVFI